MKHYTFLSIFPTSSNIQDGYIRRVDDIEQHFLNEPRKHLEISITRHWKKNVIDREDGKLQVLYLNAFLHFFLIYKIFRQSSVIYSHSILRIPKVLIQLLLIPKKIPLVVDVHGVVPEELFMKSKNFTSFLYSILEKYCFYRSRVMIYVSESMHRYYQKKYNWYKGKGYIQYINNSMESAPVLSLDNVRKELNIQEESIVIIYSGNCQIWQNTDLMLEMISQANNENYRFLILTGQVAEFKALLIEKQIPPGKVLVKSVHPDELNKYYSLAHYGFILRDDDIVNRVANPTKMGEYLQFGITPIVKLVEIGDYHLWNYEHLNFKAFNNNLLKVKSRYNHELFERLNGKYRKNNVKDICNSAFK